jgi:hypothetical protein
MLMTMVKFLVVFLQGPGGLGWNFFVSGKMSGQAINHMEAKSVNL